MMEIFVRFGWRMICLPPFSLLQARLQTGRLNQHIVKLSVGGQVVLGAGGWHLMCRSSLQSGSLTPRYVG